MNSKALVVCVLLTCLFAAVTSQTSLVHKWKIEDYPDPFSYDTYSQCGRRNSSNICDPNKIISEEKANQIDKLIWEVFRSTRCPCPSCIRNSHGYVIRVAIMPRMASIFEHENTTNGMLRNAQMFAYMLTKKWALGGSCNESLVILYSRYDHVLYTLTLPLARSVLKDEYVKRITMSVRPLFDESETIGDGLLEMIQRYKLVFEGEEETAFRPKTLKQSTSTATFLSSSFFSPSFLLSLLMTAVFMALLH